MAVTPGLRLVVLGAPTAPIDDDATAVTAALAAAGVGLESRTVVDEDETALERSLAPAAPLTVIITGPSDIARRVLARATGTRLVLNDKMLAALEDLHRRRDRPLPRRDERLALLPQGATVWAAPEGEPGWVLDTEAAAWVVLPRGGLAPATTALLTDFARGRAGRGAAVAMRTLRTAGVSLADIEERLAVWLAPGESGSDATVSIADGRRRSVGPARRAWRQRGRGGADPGARSRRASPRRSGRTATAATARRSSRRWAAGSWRAA